MISQQSTGTFSTNGPVGGADWPQTQNNHYRLDLQMYCMTVNVLSDWLTDGQLLTIKGSQPSLFQTLAVQSCLTSVS